MPYALPLDTPGFCCSCPPPAARLHAVAGWCRSTVGKRSDPPCLHPRGQWNRVDSGRVLLSREVNVGARGPSLSPRTSGGGSEVAQKHGVYVCVQSLNAYTTDPTSPKTQTRLPSCPQRCPLHFSKAAQTPDHPSCFTAAPLSENHKSPRCSGQISKGHQPTFRMGPHLGTSPHYPVFAVSAVEQPPGRSVRPRPGPRGDLRKP